jgi:hypothetical protein
MALKLSDASFTMRSAAWPVLTTALLSASLALSALMVLVEVSSELKLSLDQNDK